MIPKPLFSKAKAYVLKLRKEYESETVGKSGLAAVPIEIGRQVKDFVVGLHVPGQPRVSDEAAEECCEYFVKQGLLAKHPWGGYMVPLAKEAPEIPSKDKAEGLVHEALAKVLPDEKP